MIGKTVPAALAAVLTVAACGSGSIGSGGSSAGGPSNVDTPAADANAGSTSHPGGESTVSVSGALTLTLSGPQCLTSGSIHAIVLRGTAADGTAWTLTVTDEQGGKAALTAGRVGYAFTNQSGTLTDAGTSAHFSAARFYDYRYSTSVTVDGTVSC